MDHNEDAIDLVAQIATALGETATEPIGQITRIIARCGPERAQAWLAETQQIEASGGELLPDKNRRRTPGGVFFKLVRNGVRGRDKFFIFPKYRKPAKHPAPWDGGSTAETTPPVSWDDREQLVKEATAGKATTVKITIIGRPGKVVEQPQFTIALLKKSGPLPALPKGVPAPPQNETDYIVYIGAKQWGKVKDALKQPDDILICEGTPIRDPKFNAMTVFATNVMTKALQAATRVAKAEA